MAAKVDEFCAAMGLSAQIAYSVNLAIDEILTNTISYGYDNDDPHRIELILRLEAGALIVVTVDDSRAFDPSLVEQMPDVESSLEERALGGLGLFLVQQMMDNVEYQRRDGCNVVTVTKNTDKVEEADDRRSPLMSAPAERDQERTEQQGVLWRNAAQFAACSATTAQAGPWSTTPAILLAIRLAAAFTGLLARCAYREVVVTLLWPRSFPIIGSPSPTRRPPKEDELPRFRDCRS